MSPLHWRYHQAMFLFPFLYLLGMHVLSLPNSVNKILRNSIKKRLGQILNLTVRKSSWIPEIEIQKLKVIFAVREIRKLRSKNEIRNWQFFFNLYMRKFYKNSFHKNKYNFFLFFWSLKKHNVSRILSHTNTREDRFIIIISKFTRIYFFSGTNIVLWAPCVQEWVYFFV